MTPLSNSSVQEYVRGQLPGLTETDQLYDHAEQIIDRAINQQYLTPEQRDGGDFAALVWMYTALIDAAQNNTDFEAADYGCDKEWENAVKWMKKELGKKKFVSGKPVHNLALLFNNAAAALRCLDTDSCGRQLIEWVQHSGGSLSDFFDSVHNLGDNLRKEAEKY